MGEEFAGPDPTWSASSIAIHPSGKFAYVTIFDPNLDADEVLIFSIDATGFLTYIGFIFT